MKKKIKFMHLSSSEWYLMSSIASARRTKFGYNSIFIPKTVNRGTLRFYKLKNEFSANLFIQFSNNNLSLYSSGHSSNSVNYFQNLFKNIHIQTHGWYHVSSSGKLSHLPIYTRHICCSSCFSITTCQSNRKLV